MKAHSKARRCLKSPFEGAMTYRFKLDEPFGTELRRIAVSQVDRAIMQLEPCETAGDHSATRVHETRKGLKRTRAVLRLARPLLGDEQFKALNTKLRDIGRLLASQRDLDVLDQVVLSLKADKALKAATVTRLRRAIAAARRTAGDTILAVTAAISELQRSKAQIANLDVKSVAIDTSGLAAGLEACRDAFAAAFDGQTDEAFHELRKAMQLHWRHMQLLRNGWPSYFAARIEEARAISALVGDDRDLGLLAAFVAAEHNPKISVVTLREVRRVVRNRRTLLRKQARLRAERLLAEGTSGFCRRIETYWRTAGMLKSR